MTPSLLCAGKARGFGFAGFMCRAHAERAIKLANAKVSRGSTCLVTAIMEDLMLLMIAVPYNVRNVGPNR